MPKNCRAGVLPSGASQNAPPPRAPAPLPALLATPAPAESVFLFEQWRGPTERGYFSQGWGNKMEVRLREANWAGSPRGGGELIGCVEMDMFRETVRLGKCFWKVNHLPKGQRSRWAEIASLPVLEGTPPHCSPPWHSGRPDGLARGSGRVWGQRGDVGDRQAPRSQGA